MKKLTFFISFLPLICVSQIDTLTDDRDGRIYLAKEINGTHWMLENLDYETALSTGVTSEQQEEFDKFDLNGRYYHFQELASVCPSGWELPSVNDWKNYFEYLAKDYVQLRLEMVEFNEKNHHTSFMNYNKVIDVFKPGNPLNLYPTGRIEGKIFSPPDVYADFWTYDKAETYKGKSHIHIMNAWTTIHSHKHNLQPKRKNKLRKFMVRCVESK